MQQAKSVGGQARAGWREKFFVEERLTTPTVRRRLYLTSWGLILTGLVLFLALLVGVVTHTGIQRLDQPVETWFVSRRSEALTQVMIALAVIFGPVALPIVVVVVLLVWTVLAKHAWRPLLLAAGMAAGLIFAKVVAPLVRHPRPPVGSMLMGADSSFSFPSGHVLGTADFLLVLAFLIASRRRNTLFTAIAFSVAVLVILAQVASRLYLGYHWISDTTASMALSMVVLGAIMAIDTAKTVRIPGEPSEGPHVQTQEDSS
ncbi:MAG: phosphatase PAP2 family protein [Specibacter sp.]